MTRVGPNRFCNPSVFVDIFKYFIERDDIPFYIMPSIRFMRHLMYEQAVVYMKINGGELTTALLIKTSKHNERMSFLSS